MIVKGGVTKFADLTDIQVVYKTTDEVVNNSAVLQDDDELSFAIAANEVWHFRLIMLAKRTAASLVKVGFTGPAGAAMWWERENMWDGSNTLQSISGSRNCTLNNTAGGILFTGWIFNGATAGTFQVQWAQGAAVAEDTTVMEGSTLIGTRVE